MLRLTRRLVGAVNEYLQEAFFCLRDQGGANKDMHACPIWTVGNTRLSYFPCNPVRCTEYWNPLILESTLNHGHFVEDGGR